MIHLRRAGLNICETFPTLDAARVRAEQITKEQVRHGTAAFEFSPQDRMAAKKAMDKLAGRTTLADAVDYWLLHHPDGTTITLEELIEDYIEDMERRKCRPVTITSATNRLKRLAADFAERAAASITTPELVEWLDIRGAGPENRNNYRAVFRAAFAYAVKKGIMLTNPAEAIAKAKVERDIPEHWPVAKVEALLRAAQAFAPDMVPLLAIQAFAGLRPFEATRLDWSNIDLTEGHIRIMPAITKIRTARLVDISANLAQWLAGYRKASGRVSPPDMTIRRYRTRLAAAAVLGVEEVHRRMDERAGKSGKQIKAGGLTWEKIIADAKAATGELWPPDILRHTYATMHLATHADAFRLAELMGNSPKIIRTHYKGLATEKQAGEYWKITPAKQGRLIKLRAIA